MAQTGEKYTEARRALQGSSEDPETEQPPADDPATRGQFGRFTEYARRVIVLAREEARTLGHDFVGTEHILLGLLREGEGIAARVLMSFDITVEQVRADVVRGAGASDDAAAERPQFTAGAKRVLELALREALSLRHNYIGTEHILLGLGRESEGVAARVLLDVGADFDSLRNTVICNLSGTGGRAPSAGAAESAGESGGISERITERAREALELARRESGELGHDRTGDEHILLGLLRERQGLAGRALEALGVTLKQARASIVERVPRGDPATTGERPLTPRAMRVLELALRESLACGALRIGTEHILLALVRETGGQANAVLLDLDADPQKVREEVLNRLSAGRADPPTERSEAGRPTAQEEVEFAKRIERGDPAAKEQMADANIHLVVSIADEFRGRGLSLEELKRAGTRGLFRATDTFDYRKGDRFSSYATHWIRQAIVRALMERRG